MPRTQQQQSCLQQKQQARAWQPAPSRGAVNPHCGGAHRRKLLTRLDVRRASTTVGEQQDCNQFQSSSRNTVLKGRCPLYTVFQERVFLRKFIQLTAIPFWEPLFTICECIKHPYPMQEKNLRMLLASDAAREESMQNSRAELELTATLGPLQDQTTRRFAPHPRLQ